MRDTTKAHWTSVKLIRTTWGNDNGWKGACRLHLYLSTNALQSCYSSLSVSILSLFTCSGFGRYVQSSHSCIRDTAEARCARVNGKLGNGNSRTGAVQTPSMSINLGHIYIRGRYSADIHPCTVYRFSCSQSWFSDSECRGPRALQQILLRGTGLIYIRRKISQKVAYKLVLLCAK